MPAVILMDINLPGISGLQATEQILANPKFPAYPGDSSLPLPPCLMILQQAEGLFTAYLTKTG